MKIFNYFAELVPGFEMYMRVAETFAS